MLIFDIAPSNHNLNDDLIWSRLRNRNFSDLGPNFGTRMNDDFFHDFDDLVSKDCSLSLFGLQDIQGNGLD